MLKRFVDRHTIAYLQHVLWIYTAKMFPLDEVGVLPLWLPPFNLCNDSGSWAASLAGAPGITEML